MRFSEGLGGEVRQGRRRGQSALLRDQRSCGRIGKAGLKPNGYGQVECRETLPLSTAAQGQEEGYQGRPQQGQGKQSGDSQKSPRQAPSPALTAKLLMDQSSTPFLFSQTLKLTSRNRHDRSPRSLYHELLTLSRPRGAGRNPFRSLPGSGRKWRPAGSSSDKSIPTLRLPPARKAITRG